MNNEILLQLITASVSPAVMISGSALLVLAFLNRQGVLAGRLRELHDHALHHAELFHKEKNSYHAERAALSLQQSKAIYSRADTVKWTLVFLFLDIIAFVMASVALGVSVVCKEALIAAVVFFVAGVLSLFVSAVLGMQGALKSMTPLQREQEQTEKLIARIGGIASDGFKE